MSGEQRAVLWMGFLLILVRMLTTTQWSGIWGILKTGGTASQTTTPISTGSVRPAASQPQTSPAPVQARL
jgi:hypothetical protein